MSKIVICGALGRMGMTIGSMVNEAEDLELVGGVDIKDGEVFGCPVVRAEDMAALLEKTKPDVVIDFTIAHAAVENIKLAAASGAALVVGTTGFTEEQRSEIETAINGHVPAVISTNYSVGVNIFWKLVREASKRLGDYDIEVTEAHHHFKKDAPSGTAKTILSVIEEEVGPREKLYGREGMIGERGNEIGVHVIRGGDIVGEHSVLFAGNNEVIELSHRAFDRAVFAHGVLRSARYVTGKENRIHSMDEVLGLV